MRPRLRSRALKAHPVMKYIDAEELIAQIERLKFGARIQGFNSDYVYALDEVLSFIPFIQQEQPEAIGGVVQHALNASWIAVNQEQLRTCLKHFPEGTEVEVLINARKEE